MKKSVIIGCGAYLPERIITNKEMESLVETRDEWIFQRTGIKQRHIAKKNETTADMGEKAARRALQAANLSGKDIDLIILATSTPNHTFPATSVEIQHRLGINHGAAFDMQAVCSGFIFALTTANQYILAGQANRILVIGAETFSRILDWKDRRSCVLFGDGAGAVILEASKQNESEYPRGILTCHLRSDGAHKDKLYTDGGPSTTGTVGHLRMQGREVFRYAVSMITDVVESAFDATGTTADDIDWFIPHQANKRIIDASAKKLKISPDKVITTIQKHANTSAASIPLALNQAIHEGKIKKNNLILLEAMGGGFTWGAVIIRW